MSCKTKTCKINDYLNETRYIVLATVNGDQAPVQRTLGAFALDGNATYFSTNRETAKVEQIEANPRVSILFQQEQQDLTRFVNVSILGTARKVTEQSEVEKAIKLIGDRVPRFRERAELGNLKDSVFFRVDPSEATILDFSKGHGPAAVQKVTF
jgi:general stress protein 26